MIGRFDFEISIQDTARVDKSQGMCLTSDFKRLDQIFIGEKSHDIVLSLSVEDEKMVDSSDDDNDMATETGFFDPDAVLSDEDQNS